MLVRMFTQFQCLILSAIGFMAILPSCKKDNIQMVQLPQGSTVTTVSPIAEDTSTKHIYLALGDSYTIGQSVDSGQRYPAQTASLLFNHNAHFSGIQYIAQTGWTTLNLADAIIRANPHGPYAAVSLLIGVNDQYQTRDTTNYRLRFTNLLTTALTLAGNIKSHVFVLSIPDYGVTPFGGNNKEISDQIDQFNTINKEVTDSYKISYTDVTSISRNDANDASFIAFDGLHPSGKQYAQWAEVLESVMYKALQ